MIPTIPSWATLRLIGPELWLVIGMCAVILVPFIRRDSRALPTWTTLVTLIVALAATLATFIGAGHSVLAGMLVIDPASQFFKLLLLSFTLLVVVQWILAGRGRVHPHDGPDFLCLLLGATFGMALMASAANLLMIFMATEAASYPSYALAGFRKRDRIGAEGSLKYVIFGSASSAVMLYGMSLIYGSIGSLDLATLAAAAHSDLSPLLAVGILAMLVGVAFKLSAVPLHFWCPDVFQGAPTAVTTFLSVASKGAAVVLLLRIAQAFGAASAGSQSMVGLATGLAILGAVTATWGNLVAIHQFNIKRLLAYSSIAHAGYMIMAVALAAVTPSPAMAQDIAAAVLFYLVVYLFMNMGAFSVAALVAAQDDTEDLRDYAGLATRAPALAVLMIIFLLSLFGMPTLGGFLGKIYLAMAMLDAGGPGGAALVVVLLLNTLLSLYVYVRPIYFMVLAKPSGPQPPLILPVGAIALLVLCAAGVFWTGLLPGVPRGLAHDHAVLVTAPQPVETMTRVDDALR